MPNSGGTPIWHPTEATGSPRDDERPTMYVCHCNKIPEREIRAAMEALAQRGAPTPTPADVLLELNRFGKCLGCFALIEAMANGKDITAPQTSSLPETLPDALPAQPRRRRRRGGAFANRSET